VWTHVGKRWAYTCAGLLCIIVVALLAASLGTSWYYVTLNGFVQFTPVNATASTPNVEVYFYYEIYEYILHLETKVTIQGSFTDSLNCNYADGDCTNLVDFWYNQIASLPSNGICLNTCYTRNPPTWNLKEYLPSYGTIMAFTLASILVTVFLGILLQVICWTYDRWSPKLTLALLIVAIVAVVLLLILLVINWCILFGHDTFTRSALDVPDSWCGGGDSNDKEKGNILCTWNGNYNYNKYTNTYDRFFNLYWRNMQPTWGPNTAWILSTIAFGFVGIIFLLVVGWRPAIKL